MPKKNDKKVPFLFAISLALAVRRYGTERIARRRGSRAIREATGRLHRASMAADSRPSDIFFCDFPSFFIFDPLKSRSG